MASSNKKKHLPAMQSDESSEEDDEPVRKTLKKSNDQKAASSKRNLKLEGDNNAKSTHPKSYNPNDSIVDDPDEDIMAIPIPEKMNTGSDDMNSKGRLMIYKIHVKNFKSYYGESTIGPFHKNFTAIIGPNGSGKSNVIDALLFVFGFRSGKIRSKKISSLIHSSKDKECDSCTVSISFQKIIDKDENDYEMIAGSQFTISRTGYKNNSSTYTLDGKTVSLKVVEDTLKNCGIDLVHNRFLILQGEVEAISMMKPKGTTKNEEGMIEYLEDIIGSNRYVPLITKFDKRIERLSIELQQQQLQRDTARATKTALEPDVREAIEYLSKENEVILMKSKMEQRKRLRYLDKIKPMTEELEERKNLLKEVMERWENNKNESKENQLLEKKTQKEKAKAEEEMDKLKEEIEDELTAEKKRQQHIKRINAEIEKFEVEKLKEEKKKETLTDAPAKAAKKIEQLKLESDDLKEIEKSANEKADANMVEFDRKSAEYQDEKTAAETEFASSNTIFNEINGKTLIAQAEVEDLKKLASKGKTTLDELTKKLEEAEEKFEREKEELEMIEEEIPKKNKDFENAQNELSESRAVEQKLDREVRELKMKIDDLMNDLKRTATGNKALEMLMKKKHEGLLPGFIGRLGDLGAIDPKYDVAISTNVGFLNAYVCEDTDSAAAAIDALRNNHLGRAAFISLDKLEKRSGMTVAASEFPAPRLFDLVKCEEGMKIAFYFAIGDLLVVDNLKEAQRLDRLHNHKYTFVTLEGYKLANDASITGGSQTKRGLIGSEVKVRRTSTLNDNGETVRKLKEEMLKKQEAFNESVMLRKKVDASLFELRNSRQFLLSRSSILKPSTEQAELKIKTLKKTIESQKREAEKCHVDPAELAEKETNLKKLKNERDEASNLTAEAKKKVEEVTEKIDAIFYELVERYKKEAKESRERWLSIENTIAKETSTINNSERNIAKCIDRIKQLDKDIEKKMENLNVLNEKAVNNDELEEKKKKLNEIEEALKEFETKFKEIREKKNLLSKDDVEMEQKINETKEKIEGIEANLADKKRKVKDIEETVSNLKLNSIPRLAFMDPKAKPEDLKMEVENEFMDENDLKNMDDEQLDAVSKMATKELTDRAYSLEYRLRREREEHKEEIFIDSQTSDRVLLLSEEELRAIGEKEIDEIQFRRKTYEQQLETMKGKVNFQVVDEYIKRVQKYNTEVEKTGLIDSIATRHKARCLQLKRYRLQEFEDGYRVISKSVREVYQMLTLGGDAELDHKAGSDPFADGIQFLVRPPRKSWKNIENLSGGEKTLASLALVFALHSFRPTPFYVMDEIDAALDYRNVSIIGHYVKERTRNAQFIIISLRNNMFEMANRLIGIYKTSDCTQNVAIDPLKICMEAKKLAEKVGKSVATMPSEVTAEFIRQSKVARNEQTANEKQYENFPSTSDIARAEKIVDLETKVRKEIRRKDNHTTNGSELTREQSVALTNRNEGGERPISQNSARPESRILEKVKMPNVRLVQESVLMPMSSSSRHNSETREGTPSDQPPAKKVLSEEAGIEKIAELNAADKSHLEMNDSEERIVEDDVDTIQKIHA